MNRTISPVLGFSAVILTALALIAGIAAARSVSADHQARQCVAQGFNAAQCWEDASPTF